MAKAFDLLICGNALSITTDGKGQGEIEQGLPREHCPSCDTPDCCHSCDGSQGADENNDETDDDTAGRLKYNGFVDAIESIALAHACAGVNIGDTKYVEGLETALTAAGNNL